MVDLISSLGLDKVEADPNAVPDGLWPGEITKAEFVCTKKGGYALAITFTIDEGERKGAQQSKWYMLGEDPIKDDAGNVVSYKPTMKEQAKSYFKKDLESLGVPESAMANFDPASLVGKKVNFRTKKNGEWININFIELRYDGGFAPTTEATASAPFEAPVASPTGFDPSAL